MRLIVCWVALLLANCVRVGPNVARHADIIEHIRDSTVVIVTPAYGLRGTYYLPTCAGVWIGYRTFLTAHHCVDSTSVMFRTREEARAQWDAELTLAHEAHVVRSDPDRDLALVYVDGGVPSHAVATLAASTPDDGDRVHIMGHTAGFQYSYMPGTVSASRTIPTYRAGKPERLLQVSSPAFRGNSGGGAFDGNGRLVGICSFMSGAAPNVTFFVHTDALREFL